MTSVHRRIDYARTIRVTSAARVFGRPRAFPMAKLPTCAGDVRRHLSTRRVCDRGNELLALSICHENSAVRFTLSKAVSSTMASGRQKLPTAGH